MKKTLILIISTLLLIPAAMNAQQHGKEKDHNGFKEKMIAEKIAYFTTELNLTPEEAQVFWPAYNSFAEKKDKAWKEARHAYKAMDNAIKEGKDSKEVEQTMKAYEEALKNAHKVELSMSTLLKGVIPIEKIAKAYMAEEGFRRHLLHKLQPKK